MAMVDGAETNKITHLRGEAWQANDSRRLAEPAELAGDWIVTGGSKPCPISLLVDRVDSANAWGLRGGCIDDLLDGVVGWRTEPDGIAMVRADGLTRAMFADRGDGTWVAVAGGARLTLSRAAARRAGPA